MEANGVGALGCKKLVNDNIKLGVFIIYYSCHDLIPMYNSLWCIGPLKVKICQHTVGLMFTFPQTKVNYYLFE